MSELPRLLSTLSLSYNFVLYVCTSVVCIASCHVELTNPSLAVTVEKSLKSH
jgi:hypothetical protein